MLHALSIDTVGFNGLPHEAGFSLLSYFNWEECTGVGLQSPHMKVQLPYKISWSEKGTEALGGILVIRVSELMKFCFLFSTGIF